MIRKKKLQKFEPKKYIILPYKNYAKKNNAKIQAKKVPNTNLQKLCQGKTNHKFELKKHLTLPYKNYAKKKKFAEILARKAPNITL